MPVRFAHTNIVADDWKALADFYMTVFDCSPVPPQRDLSGKWLDRVTGLQQTRLRGMHLRLPGHGENGPTLEIFQYDSSARRPAMQTNTPGLAHLAFEVDDVEATSALIRTQGGSLVGSIERREIAGAGTIVLQYTRDPEGNIVEIQSWE